MGTDGAILDFPAYNRGQIRRPAEVLQALMCHGSMVSSDNATGFSMYRAVTRDIEVTVSPKFLPERSAPDKGHFFWAYTIEITNLGRNPVQLLTRHWHITDAQGRVQEVRGAGVIGEQPALKPGESFEYTSGVPLPTPSGFMSGSYGMITEDGERFDVDIPAFSLDSAQGARTIN